MSNISSVAATVVNARTAKLRMHRRRLLRLRYPPVKRTKVQKVRR
jgi:hypothetical protein